MKQKTLKGSFSLFGKGLHTGLNLTVTFNPAPENTGYKIQRIDLEGEPVIDAIAENVVDTQRGTVIGKGDARVSTVEHGLAALYAMGIDNCKIQVNGPEFPILDGSAIQYVEKIKEVGVEELNAPKDWYVIRKKIEVKDENTGSCITILPDEDFSLTAMCSFESKFINSQFATLEKAEEFETEIAAARTFVFVRDIEPCCRQTSSRVVIWTMPSSSMSDRQHRSVLTSLLICCMWSTVMPQNWDISSISHWYGRMNVPAISCWILSAIWL